MWPYLTTWSKADVTFWVVASGHKLSPCQIWCRHNACWIGYKTFLIRHVTTHGNVIKGHATWWLLITSHHPVKSSSNRLRGSKDVTIFICHVNSRNHVIQKICSFLVGHMTLNHKQHFCQVWQQQVKRKWIYNIFHLCDLILPCDQQVMWLGY